MFTYILTFQTNIEVFYVFFKLYFLNLVLEDTIVSLLEILNKLSGEVDTRGCNDDQNKDLVHMENQITFTSQEERQ